MCHATQSEMLWGFFKAFLLSEKISCPVLKQQLHEQRVAKNATNKSSESIEN